MNVKNWSIRLWPLCIVTYVTFAVLFGRHFLAPGGIQKRLETSNPDPTDFLLDNLESLATHEKFIIRSHCQKQVRPLFDRLVFILIDAFRADFVSHIRSQLPLSSPIVSYYLPFVDKLIRDGAAVTAMAEARTPTVTMPRLKAMLSGTQSSFFDLFENLNSKHLQEDNLVSKAYSAGKRLVFYGDDTWLQLFDSTIFIRHNQTNSFFATDYTSVDTNVTENLLPEMDRAHEWDCTFAHYLGVDHIGHSWGGAWSQLMQPKLIEMDAVIERIVQTAAEKYSDMDFLIAIVGDHGMTDVGNHGGNTDPETHTAAVFTSSAMYFGNRERKAKGLPTKTEFIRQSDISVLLSSLLGLGIPSRSEGRFSSRLFDQLTSHKPNSSTVKLCYQLQNSAILRLQLPEVASKFVHLLDAATRNHLNSIRNLNESESSVQRASSMYDQFLHVLQMAQPHVKSEHLDLQSLISFTFAQFAIIVFLLLFTNEQVQIELFTTKVWQQFSIDSTAILYFSAVSSIVQALLLISTSFVDSENYYSMYIALTITVFWLKTHYDNLLTNSNSIQVLALSLIVNHWAVEDRPSLITFFNLNQSDFILPVISFISILALSAHLAGQTKFQFQKLVYCLFGVIISSIK